MTSTQPEWPAVGDRVAVFTWHHTSAAVVFDTVDRLTGTQILLNSGSRFRRSDLGQIGGDSKLRRPEDQPVVAVVVEKAIQRLRFNLDQHLKAGATSSQAAFDLLDTAERLVAGARRTITEASATPTAD